jgi:hypothetical protein
MNNETNTVQETQFVLRRLEEALRFFGREFDAHWLWVFVLAVVLGAGLFFISWMYRRESRTIGWKWAAFLGALRGLVYCILAGVFLLPALQTWERSETHSKVVILTDVSSSMENKDDVPTDAIPVEKLPSRQDKVVRLLTDSQVGFLKELQKTNPVYVYRFGNQPDEEFKVLAGEDRWSAAEWSGWLKPSLKEVMPEGLSDEQKESFLKKQELHQQLIGGTNIGDSLLEVLNRESNNMLEGVIVITDGRNTQYKAQAFEDIRAWTRRAKVPIFAVAVGEHRLPISIRVAPLQAPEQVRPDDKFPVRVEVDGEGLPHKEMSVSLDVTLPSGEKRTVQKPFKFNAGVGGPPHAQIEFDIDAAEFGAGAAAGGKRELAEGEWKFQARVPKDKREIFLEKEHTSAKAVVRVVKKPLRILLFTGAGSHEYQFVRNLFVREADQRRAELSICMQIQREGVVQDVPPDRLLKHFPSRLSEDTSGRAEDRYSNLALYDLIVAFDPDWTQMAPEQLAALERWVSNQAGGLILVAGGVNTYQLARPTNREGLKPLLDLFPVILQDSRLQGLGVERLTTDPWRLHFPGATADMEFLKLEEGSSEPEAGWEEFFTGKAKVEAGKEPATVRGFYSYYPVEGVKPSAIVVATYSDPRARMRNSEKEQPYLVTMAYGSGRVVYIGSSETWRLRQFREAYHERFWTKLARFAGSGNLTRASRRGVIVMGQEFTSEHMVTLQAQLFGRDLQPLPASAAPKIQVQPPSGVAIPPPVALEPQTGQGGEWAGWFQGRFRVGAPGEYHLSLPIPDTGETLVSRFMVKEANPELEDTRPDFDLMYSLAGEVTDVLPRLKERKDQDELKRVLEATAARLLKKAEDTGGERDQEGGRATGRDAPGGATKPRTTSNESATADRSNRKDDKTKAARSSEAPRLLFDLSTAGLIPKCMVTDSKVQRSRGPVKDLWDEGFSLGFDSSTRMAFVLLVIVILLSVEWLTRKLLKMA